MNNQEIQGLIMECSSQSTFSNDMETNELHQDAEGTSFKIMHTIFQGEKVSYPPGYTGLNHVLNSVGSIQCKPQDIWLLSFPKSGTHWVYHILSMLTTGKLSVSVPLENNFIEMMKDFSYKSRESHPVIFGSHLKMKYLPESVFTQQRVIVCIRNPKSVAVSAYSYRVRSNESEYSGKFAGFLPLFMQGEFTCIGNWFQYVKHYWKTLRGKPNVLFLFYEDLKKNPVAVVKTIASFLGCNHTEEFLEQVVEAATFEKMKEEETTRLSADGNTFWKEGQEGIIRKGLIEDWKNYFTVAQNELFDSLFRKEMEDMPDLKDKIQFE